MSNSALADGLRLLRGQLAARCRTEDSDEQLLHAFLTCHDEDAFALLVRRHGPMVLHVCRRVLGHEQDAEDAFQAVFLVLARHTARLRKQASLASFLHGIAYRTALKAKQAAGRRRRYESQAPSRSASNPADELSWREIRMLLDQEITRLPEIYRSAFVLCCLEELSREEAARRLRVNENTLSSRLAEARKRLAQRLARRGVELTTVLAVSGLAASTAAALPPGLVSTTVKAALGGGTVSLVSAPIARLARSAASTTLLNKTKMATVMLMGVSLLVGAGIWWNNGFQTLSGGRQPPEQNLGGLTPPAPKADTSRSTKPEVKTVDVRGRVLDPDGKPVRDAKLLLAFKWIQRDIPNKVWATSDTDGRFQFSIPGMLDGEPLWPERDAYPYVLAAAKGFGFAVVALDKPEAAANLMLRLVKDDMPIRGRIVNLEGKPLAGVRVRISSLEPLNQGQIYLPKAGDLTTWLAGLKARTDDPWPLERAHLIELRSHAFHLLIPPVTTGADGRFEIRGIGRERLVRLRLEGPTIATQIVNVMTRRSEKIRLPLSRAYLKREAITYHGADCEILTRPTKPVEGVVRDRDTGKPMPGVTVMPNKITNPWNISNYNYGIIRTTTDKEGRYRLVGLPKGDDNQLLAWTDNLPYIPVSSKVENTPGLGTVTLDFAMKRGIWVKGRVIEKGTGKSLRGGVGYYCFSDNPHKKEIPLLFGGCPALHGSTREDGSYRVVAVPGHGLIAVQVQHNDRYLSGVGADQIKAPHVHPGIDCFDTYPSYCQIPNRNTLVEINPKPDDESITCDLIVVPGRSMKGIVLGPDGKPLAGARRWRSETLPGSEFTVWGLPPGKLAKPWEIEFTHEGKKLAGFVTVHGDEKEPLQVRLQPWGAVTGRLITPQGEPITDLCVSCQAGDAFPDKQGRFRIEGLTPGRKYEVYVSKEGFVRPFVDGELKFLTVKPGETKDLGDLKVKRME